MAILVLAAKPAAPADCKAENMPVVAPAYATDWTPAANEPAATPALVKPALAKPTEAVNGAATAAKSGKTKKEMSVFNFSLNPYLLRHQWLEKSC